MSEVKRYWVPNGTLVDQSGWHQDDSEVVQAWAFDRVTAELDAALADAESLRESLRTQTLIINSIANARDALQQRLTAADDRMDVLETALKKISVRCVAYLEAEREMPEPSVEVCQMIAEAALKPAWGGGDE